MSSPSQQSLKRVRIADICTGISSGGTPSTREMSYYGGSIPWLRTQEVNFGHIYSTEKTITEKGLVNSSAKLIPPNSVIVAMYGATAGKVAINKVQLTTNQACCNLIIDPSKADYEYIYYYLLNNYRKILSAATGAAQQNLGTQQIANFRIDLPDLKEQRRLAGILSAIDGKVELNRQMDKTLEQIGQTIFRDYFIDNPKAIKRQEGKLGQLADINARSIDKSYSQSQIIYVDIAGVSTGSIDKEELMPLMSAPSRAKRIIHDGDIIWSTVRPNRRAYALVLDPPDNLIASTGFAVISPKENALGYVYYLASSQAFTDYLVLHSRGAAYPAVTASDFKNMPVSLPDLEDLISFNQVVLPSLKKISSLKYETKNLIELRNSLLPRLISGGIKQ